MLVKLGVESMLTKALKKLVDFIGRTTLIELQAKMVHLKAP